MTVNVYILLDRSGSMQSRWEEALGTINGYVAELAKAGHEGAVTCACFDNAWLAGAIAPSVSSIASCTFEVLRQAVRPQDWKPLSNEDASPRGGTPLYDAIGRINGLASADVNPKGVIVIMTDGEENASREVTQHGAKAMLDQQRQRGWSIVQLGVEFDAYKQAHGLGTHTASTMTLGKGGMRKGFVAETLSHETVSYSSGATMDMAFSAADKARAAEPDDNLTKAKAARP